MLLFIRRTKENLQQAKHISIHLMLLFINFQINTLFPLEISIHLMLLFIQLLVALVWTSIYFNTSHVTVYQCKGCRKHNNYYISIHLMLLFISLHLFFLHLTYRISIHLMLLFIGFCVFCIIPIILISIHLMLLFIFSTFQSIPYTSPFKYISCYCFSK